LRSGRSTVTFGPHAANILLVECAFFLKRGPGAGELEQIQDYATSRVTPLRESTCHLKNPKEEIAMTSRKLSKSHVRHAAGLLAVTILAAAGAAGAVAAEPERGVFVLTSTNDASANEVVVFKLDTSGTPSLSLVDVLPTQGKGGAGNNAGILQFKENRGAVGNYGSNSVSRIVRDRDFISVEGTIGLAPNCTKPDSVALTEDHLLVVGANCAESHRWPSGNVDGTVVALTDPSAAQIVVGRDWAAVTLTSGSLLQLPLTWDGALRGSSAAVTLPSTANNTPLGAAFWDDVLGFTPAHSPDSFAIVNKSREVFPITGPTPPYPTNAPCWVAKGPGSVWYTGNSPGHAISIFLTDGEGGVFYKSIPLPGAPSDITVSPDKKWLAVIYSAAGGAYVAVFAIDVYGDLTPAAISSPIGVASFSGVAISE
jgi:hypothetical protein